MTEAWDRQVGGDHYKSEYQHWDWVVACQLGYFEGQATRYICRWRKPNGGEGEKDLRKAVHYLDKLMSVVDKIVPPREGLDKAAETRRFADVNALTVPEEMLLFSIARWKDIDDLAMVRHLVSRLLMVTYGTGNMVPRTDSNKHSAQGDEERNYADRA